jgi:hypothetical protein
MKRRQRRWHRCRYTSRHSSLSLWLALSTFLPTSPTTMPQDNYGRTIFFSEKISRSTIRTFLLFKHFFVLCNHLDLKDTVKRIFLGMNEFISVKGKKIYNIVYGCKSLNKITIEMEKGLDREGTSEGIES